jgi:hypothetical protein
MVFRPLGGVFHRHPVFTTMALDSGDAAAVGVLSYNADKDTFDLTLTLDAIPATAFSPAGHSVILNVVQLQL